MGDHLGRAQAAQLATAGQSLAVGEPEQEARRVEVAGAGRVDDLAHTGGRHFVGLVPGDDDRAVLAHRDGRDRAKVSQLLERFVEVGPCEECEQLRLVGEQDVDVAVGQEFAELVSPVVDAERIGQRERHPAARVVRQLHRLPKGVLRGGRIPEIALEVRHVGSADGVFVDLVGRQLVCRAEVGAEGAVGVVADAGPVHGAEDDRGLVAEQDDAEAAERVGDRLGRLDPTAAERVADRHGGVNGEGAEVEIGHGEPPRAPLSPLSPAGRGGPEVTPVPGWPPARARRTVRRTARPAPGA